MSPDDAPREHFSNLADPPWSIVAGGRVLGTGSTGTDAWRAVLATAEAALATARAEGAAAERARILNVIRERAASRRAQMRACTDAGSHIDALAAKESECGALAAIIDGTATMPRWPGRPVEGA